MSNHPTPPSGESAPPSLEERLRNQSVEMLGVYGLAQRSVLWQAADELARLRADVARLTAELNEADRRAGAAERRCAGMDEERTARERWLRRAKEEAKYDDTVSFDVVWAETLEKARRADAAEARAARAEEAVEYMFRRSNYDDVHRRYMRMERMEEGDAKWDLRDSLPDEVLVPYGAMRDLRRALTEGADR
jgi:hypothetical protein